jgi:hypothetical protein
MRGDIAGVRQERFASAIADLRYLGFDPGYKSGRVLTELLAALQRSATTDFKAAAGARVEHLTAEQRGRTAQIAQLAANKGLGIERQVRDLTAVDPNAPILDRFGAIVSGAGNCDGNQL